MNDGTHRYGLGSRMDDDAVQLGDVLEPQNDGYADEPYDEGLYAEADEGQPYADSYGEDAQYADDPYAGYAADPRYPPEGYDEEYSEYHEEMDAVARFKIAMGVFDTISIGIGVLVILGLVALLLSLLGWLRTDILHSVLLLQSGLQ